jgi:hypothetical protein
MVGKDSVLVGFDPLLIVGSCVTVGIGVGVDDDIFEGKALTMKYVLVELKSSQ